LCLTVYESKGLEFKDVILYNFFDGSEASSSHWKLLHDIEYEKVRIPKFDDDILDFDMLDAENFKDFQKKIKAMEKDDEACEYEEKTTIALKDEGFFSKKSKTTNIYKQYSLLCIELKYLYVAVTRAKNRVIIYDDFKTSRESIQNYWEKLGLVEVVTK
jgi:ATP-dependent exoDNAse (exonuclease V) beta subunit